MDFQERAPEVCRSIRMPGKGDRARLAEVESRPRASYVGVERRRFPRIEIIEHIQGHVVPLNMQVAVIDMSLGGLCIQTTDRFPIGAILNLHLTVDGGTTLNISARVVRSLRTDGTNRLTDYFIGVEFVADETSGTSLPSTA